MFCSALFFSCLLLSFWGLVFALPDPFAVAWIVGLLLLASLPVTLFALLQFLFLLKFSIQLIDLGSSTGRRSDDN